SARQGQIVVCRNYQYSPRTRPLQDHLGLEQPSAIQDPTMAHNVHQKCFVAVTDKSSDHVYQGPSPRSGSYKTPQPRMYVLPFPAIGVHWRPTATQQKSLE